MTTLEALLHRALRAFWSPEHGGRPLHAPERMYSALVASGAFLTRTPPLTAPMPTRTLPDLTQTEIEVLFRSWWSLSYQTPPGVHAINTHVGFAAWLLAESAKEVA
jgi:hypothetical protein